MGVPPAGALVAITIKARVKAAIRRVVDTVQIADTVQIVDTTNKEEVVLTNNVAVDPIKIKEEVTTITRGITRTTEMKTKTGITNKIGIIIIDQLVPADFLLKEAHAVMVITADLCMISNHLAKQNIAGFSTKILYQSQLDNEKKTNIFLCPVSVHVCYLICLYTYKILSNLSCFLAILAILAAK